MNSQKRNEKIMLREFIPDRALSSKGSENSYELRVKEDEIYLSLAYNVPSHNHLGLVSRREFVLLLPGSIKRSQETFEVIGLLQAEMGKQHDGKIVFCNHEHKLINKVTNWFDKELHFPKDNWKWYIKVNINEPEDDEYKQFVEYKVITHWLHKTGLTLDRAYPKRVSYIKDTKKQENKRF